jgi:hypothetical protein
MAVSATLSEKFMKLVKKTFQEEGITFSLGSVTLEGVHQYSYQLAVPPIGEQAL